MSATTMPAPAAATATPAPATSTRDARPAKPKSDAHAYLERRGWTPNPHNNLWQRVNVAPQDDGSDRITVLEEALEPLAFERQTARDISALIARVETLSGESAARLATITALEAKVARLEKGGVPAAPTPKTAAAPVTPTPPAPTPPAPALPAKGGR